MGDLFYEAFRYAHRPGNTLEVLAQPFPGVRAYAERVTDTLRVARSADDVAQGRTICTLCDIALAALPRRDATMVPDVQRKAVLCRRALKNVGRETRHELAAYGANGTRSNGEYDVRARNTLPTDITLAFRTFIEKQEERNN